MAVAWGLVRSLTGFPDAGPTGADHIGGGCLLSSVRFAMKDFRYVDGRGSDYVDIEPLLSVQTEGNPSSLRTLFGLPSDSLRALFGLLSDSLRTPFRIGLSSLHSSTSF